MALKLKCDICGVKLGSDNIGIVRHPVEKHLNPIMRCKECHGKIKGKRRKKNSSYMIID